MKFKGPNVEYDGQLFPDGEFDLGNSGAGTVTIDFAKGNRQKITMTGNCTFAAPSNLKAGATYVLRLIGDTSALRTPTWNAIFKWSGPTPTLSGASSQDIFAFYCDGTNLYGSTAIPNGLFLGRTVLTSGTTFTTSSRTKKILVQLLAGGGGGGGSDGSASNASAAGGGGAGSYSEKMFDVTPSTNYTYAIGGGGAGGANTGGTGTGGGVTTFAVAGTTVTTNGGSGGIGMTTGNTALTALGGAGGVVSTNGDVNTVGQPGGFGLRFSGTIAISGFGGPSPRGGGGGLSRNTTGIGNAAGNYGGGGSGACSIGNNDHVGGAGANGVIIVWEFS